MQSPELARTNTTPASAFSNSISQARVAELLSEGVRTRRFWIIGIGFSLWSPIRRWNELGSRGCRSTRLCRQDAGDSINLLQDAAGACGSGTATSGARLTEAGAPVPMTVVGDDPTPPGDRGRRREGAPHPEVEKRKYNARRLWDELYGPSRRRA